MRTHRDGLSRIVLLVLLAVLPSCGSESNSITGPQNPGGGDQTVARVSVTPATASVLGVGATQQFQARAQTAGGSTLTATFSWTSSDTSVATIDQSGTATAAGIGSATITAMAAGVSGSATLTVSELPAKFEGFDFQLSAGDYWDFYWSYEYNSASGPLASGQVQDLARAPAANTHSVTGGHFRITLGAPQTIDGVTAYELVMSGDYDDGEWDYTPRWKYLGVADDQVLGSVSGQSLEVIFDAKTGVWMGGGFWAAYGDQTEVTASAGSIQNDFIEAEAVVVQRSSGQSFCEVIAGHTICPNDQAWTFSESEYFKRGIGPVGLHSYAGYSFSGGGFFDSFSHDRKVGLVASSLAGADSVVPLAPPWVEKTDMPTARARHSAVPLNGKIYVLGGEVRANNTITVLSDVDVYDPTTDTWTAGTPMPDGRSFHTSTVVDGKIYVVGGIGPGSGTRLDNVWQYDPSTDQWTSRTPAPVPLANHSTVEYGGLVWVFPDDANDVYAYFPGNDTWYAGTSSPNRYAGHAAAVVGDMIYLLGGGFRDWSPWGGYFTNYTKNCLAYDLTVPVNSPDAWNWGSPMAVERAALATAVVGNMVYAIGGYKGEPVIAVEAYAPATDTWTKRFPLLAPLQEHTAVVVNGRIYVMGGSEYWDSKASVLEYDPGNDW